MVREGLFTEACLDGWTVCICSVQASNPESVRKRASKISCCRVVAPFTFCTVLPKLDFCNRSKSNTYQYLPQCSLWTP